MRALIALTRKNALDSRWLIASLATALFWLSWLFVKATNGLEGRMKAAGGPVGGMRMLRGMGGASMDFSSAAIEVAHWNLPLIAPMFAAWAIARGSAGVAGEIEKGTLDLVMSRPVGRSAFLLAQVISATLGLVLMAAILVLGHLVGIRSYPVDTPPSVWLISKPALNAFALGWAVYGYSLLLSTFDHIRWRPNLIASIATLAGFIAPIVGNLPTFEDYKKYLDAVSVFKAYNPVEVVTTGETFGFNVGVLMAVGAVGVALSFVVFARRDLPAGS